MSTVSSLLTTVFCGVFKYSFYHMMGGGPSVGPFDHFKCFIVSGIFLAAKYSYSSLRLVANTYSLAKAKVCVLTLPVVLVLRNYVLYLAVQINSL